MVSKCGLDGVHDWYRSGLKMYCRNCNGFRKVSGKKLAKEMADKRQAAQEARDEVQVRIAFALERIANNIQQIRRGLEHSYQKPFDVYVSMDGGEE